MRERASGGPDLFGGARGREALIGRQKRQSRSGQGLGAALGATCVEDQAAVLVASFSLIRADLPER